MANFVSASQVLSDEIESIQMGTPPKLYRVGDGELSRIEVGPGLVVLFGGAPGAGKTALSMQLIVDALRLDTSLRALVCNVEMSTGALVDRQLARLSGIDAHRIRHREMEEVHYERIEVARAALDAIAQRLFFLQPPFSLSNIEASADQCEIDVLLVDYLQRLSVKPGIESRRMAVEEVMTRLRGYANAGLGVFAISALSRSKDKMGRSAYDSDGLGLASFRESSELEFGADAAWLVLPHPSEKEKVLLRHVKERYGEPRDMVLHFHKPTQQFSADIAELTQEDEDINEKIAELWNSQ